MKSRILALQGFVLFTIFTTPAFANVGDDAGDDIGLIRIIKSLTAQLEAIGSFVFVVAFLVGMFFAYLFYQCLSKMSDEQARKQENLVPKMVTYFLAAAGFMFLGVMPVILGEATFGVTDGPSVGKDVDTEKFGFEE
jgi:amino acid transporter